MENFDQYYIIGEPCGNEVGNVFPQSSIMLEDETNVNETENVRAVMKCVDKLPSFVPKFGKVVLSDKARLTDVISSVHFNRFIGKIMNERALNIFQSYKLPQHKPFPLEIVYRDKVYSYFWVHIVSQEYEAIDFQKSRYKITSSIGKKIEEIVISSFADYVEKRKSFKVNFIKPELLYLQKSKLNLDLFQIRVGFLDFIISNNLKKSLEENKITGLEIEPMPTWIHFE